MKRYMTIALAVLALAACRKNVEPEMTPGKVQIEPIITKATEVNFENGDRIGLTMAKVNDTENHADNALLTYNGEVFSGNIEWYSDAYSESDIHAYYPYDPAGTPETFSVETDQTSGIGASDLMAASKKGVLPTYNAVSMVFKHQMTKIVIKIDNQSGKKISEVLIKNSIPAAKVDIANLSTTVDATAAPADIKAYPVAAGSSYTAIIVPQTAALKLAVVLESSTITQPMASMNLKSGGQYTIDVRIIEDGMTITASGEIENWTDEGEIEFEGGSSSEDNPGTEDPGDDTEDFKEYDGYFVYGGVEYKTVKLADGNTWMAENLRYIPEGRTVSSDPAEDAGIWYPAANADKTADPALAQTLGLLYDAATAFGTKEITAANAGTFEGCQGICPQGWHIPTVADMTGLVGHCSNSDLTNPDGAYYDSAISGASLTALSEAGWAWTFASCRNKTNTGAAGTYLSTSYDGKYGIMSYIIGSTMHDQPKLNDDGSLKNIQYYYMMPTYNAKNEKVTVAYGNFLAGASIRCVKNK